MIDVLASPIVLGLAALVVLFAVLTVVFFRRWQRLARGTDLEKNTFSTLHTVALAAPALREGLSASSVKVALPFLRQLLETRALAMTDGDGQPLAWDGDSDHHLPDVLDLARDVVATGRQQVKSHSSLECEYKGSCEVRGVVVVPLGRDDKIIATLAALSTGTAGPSLLRAAAEVGRYVSSQLELAELDESRQRLNRAEVLALRAQISPHFIYNALTTIASLCRTDPPRARELVLSFADFTRYSFRDAGADGGGLYTTLKAELENIERYTELEKARFGERFRIELQIAPEVLNVVMPFLALQPLVENAVRHGLAGRTSGGRIAITAENAGSECVIVVEDNGIGMDPDRLKEDLADAHLSGAHVGLGNVNDRMRSAFGEDFGLEVETDVGRGMKITLRVPKFKLNVRAGA